MCKQVELATQAHKVTAYASDRHAIVLPEISNCLEVRHQPFKQPHQFDVSLRFPLETPTRLNTIEVAVEIQLEKDRRVISRTPRGKRLDALKTQLTEIQRLDIGINHSDRIVLVDEIVGPLRHQNQLIPIRSLYESLHRLPSSVVRSRI